MARHKPKKKRLPRQAKAFALWLSIPVILKDNKYIEKHKSLDLKGDKENLVPKLMKCTNENQVAEVLGVSRSTLVDWKKLPKFRELVDKFDLHCNALRFKNEVNFAFTQATIKNADASRVKLWKQLYEGFEEKSNVGHQLEEEKVRDIQKRLQEVGNKDTSGFKLEQLQNEVQSKLRESDEAFGSDQS